MADATAEKQQEETPIGFSHITEALDKLQGEGHQFFVIDKLFVLKQGNEINKEWNLSDPNELQVCFDFMNATLDEAAQI